ncbi:major capsid protein [Aeromonas dhakensis]|uniref:major capsid protein n=1 Tax=Aeromonas dhakensis TaxID=196024 RepID=UPI0005A5E040|nr:major capsid protein [Aeromonas dhakensis]
METQAKKLLKKLGVGAAVVVASTAPAFAAVDAAITTKLTDAGADAAVIGGAVLVLVIGIAAFKYMRRAV